MMIIAQNTDETVLAELGARLARTRLEANITQGQLAAEAGVGLATLERMEAGQTTKLSSFIRVLRALGLLDALDRLVPEPTPSPLERLKLRGKQRRRAASPARATSPTEHRRAAEPRPWSWGDEPVHDT
jgi:transcriptional regulator with XRE-family HTH domain